MQAAPRASHDLADAVFRVGRAYGMTADRSIYQAVAVTDGRITAVGRSRDELDSFTGPGTAVIDDSELVLYPAFNDTHNHRDVGGPAVGTPSWPTRRPAPGRCGWGSGSLSSIRCCTRWAATWCGTGGRTAPARSCRSGPGSTRGRRPVHDPDGLLGSAGRR